MAIAAKSVEAIKEWIQAYQEHSNCIYSIRSTDGSKGKFINFKQRLHCKHNTQRPRACDPLVKTRSKNTNCPSMMRITLRAVKQVYRGKDLSKAPDSEMPCEILLVPNHNHETSKADALRCQTVSSETKDKLINLFELGHTAASALESLKMDIHLNSEDYEKDIGNRKHCPDYKYCHYLYMTQFTKKFGPIEGSREMLIKRLEEYNKETNENSAQVVFDGPDYAVW